MDIEFSLNINLSYAECKRIAKAFERPGELQGNPTNINFNTFLNQWKEKHPFADKVWDFIKEIENNDFTP